MKTARYVGGLLDGQHAEKTAGRWCIYRDDDGQPISTARGDKEFCTDPRVGQPLTRFYAHKQYLNRDTWTLQDIYIHATAWNEWKGKVR